MFADGMVFDKSRCFPEHLSSLVLTSVRHGPGQPMGYGPGRATGRAGPEFWDDNGLWAGPGLQAQNNVE